jgi:hypothetical protein
MAKPTIPHEARILGRENTRKSESRPDTGILSVGSQLTQSFGTEFGTESIENYSKLA